MLRTPPVDMQVFARIAAHDLKAPLHGVASLVECFEEDFAEALGERGREDLRLLRRLAHRGIALVDGLKRFTTAASAPLRVQALDVAALARRACRQVAAQHEDLPPIRPGVCGDFPTAAGDATLVAVLLEQLVQNAVVFRDGESCWVEIAAAAPGDASRVPDGHAAFVVGDRGIGMPARHLDEVFELFKRLHGVDAYGGGGGCGLAIARQIVDRHGGAIWAEAREGGGTRLTFTLPRTAEALA